MNKGFVQPYRLTRSISVGLLFVLLLIAVFPGTSRARAANQTTQTNITVAVQEPLDNLDPSEISNTDEPLVARQIYDTLTVLEPDASAPVPSLAQSWSVSADGKTWTFTLPSGVKFHDGTNLDASAVVFNFQRWWDPANPYHDASMEYFAYIFFGFKGDANCFLAGVSAPDANTLVLTLSHPFSPLPTLLANPALSIASPAAIQAGTLSTHPVGSGPFKFTSQPDAGTVNLAANATYWGGAPLLETLTFQRISDETQRLTALQNGTVQVAENFSDANLAALSADTDFRIHWRPSTVFGYMGINRAHGPLDNLLVRQAISHAIDKDALIKAHYAPGTQPASQILPPSTWGYDPNLQSPAYNPTLAKDLLTQAGYPNGFTTTLSYRDVMRIYLPDPTGIAQQIAAQLAVVGITATPTAVESSEFLTDVSNGNVDLFLLGWGMDYPHPDNAITPVLCGAFATGFGGRDSTLCDALDNAQEIYDQNQLLTLYRTANQHVADTLPLDPLVYARTSVVMHKDVAGLIATPMGWDSYFSVSLASSTETTVSPADGGELVITNPETSTVVTVQVPPEAVGTDVNLAFTPLASVQSTSGLAFANQAFDLNAYQNNALLDGFRFAQPVTVTITYSDADVAGLDESRLLIYYFNGTQWVDAAQSCTPVSTYTRDLEANSLSVDICHLSRFGLFERPLKQLYLPLLSGKAE